MGGETKKGKSRQQQQTVLWADTPIPEVKHQIRQKSSTNARWGDTNGQALHGPSNFQKEADDINFIC